MKLNKRQIIDGKIEILCTIGHGAFASVYQAYHSLLEKKIALKVLDPYELSGETRQRFQLEAKLSTQLNSPHIVRVYSFGELGDGTPYFAMEFIEGESLENLLAREGKLAPERAVELMLQILDGLNHAHKLGIVHRDLKPGNVLLTKESPPRAKISDFGLAKFLLANQHLTKTGEVCGTVQYMSPEQVCGQGLDGQTDIYSAGCILYECLSGTPPFSGDTFYDIANAHCTLPVPTLPNVPPALNQIIANATAKDAVARYKDADSFASDLQTAQNNGTVEPLRMPILSGARRTFCKNPFLLSLLTSIIFCIGILSLANFERQQGEEKRLRQDIAAARLADDPAEKLKILQTWVPSSRSISRELYFDVANIVSEALLDTVDLRNAQLLSEMALCDCPPSNANYQTLVETDSHALEMLNRGADSLAVLKPALKSLVARKHINDDSAGLADRAARIISSHGRPNDALALLRQFNQPKVLHRKTFKSMVVLYSEIFGRSHLDLSANQMIADIDRDLGIRPGSNDELLVDKGVFGIMAEVGREDELDSLLKSLTSRSLPSETMMGFVFNLAQYQMKLDRWDLAEKYFRPYLDSEDMTVRTEALSLWGGRLFRSDRYDQLKPVQSELMRLEPTSYEPWLWLSILQSKSNDRKGAVLSLRRAFKLSPEVYHMACVKLPPDIVEEASKGLKVGA